MCGGSFMSGIAPQINSALGGGTNPLQSSGGGGGFFGGAIGGIAPQIGGMGLGGMPAPMQNPFMGGQPPQISSVNTTTTQDIMGRGANYPVGGGMGQPLSRAQLEAAVADDIATGRAIYRGPEGTQIHNDMIAKLQGTPSGANGPMVAMPGPVGTQTLQKLLQDTPSGANGPYPAQVSTLPFQPQQISLQQQQQRMMDQLNQQFGRQMQPYQQQMDQLQQKYMGQPPQELLRFDQEFQKMPEYQAMQKAAQSGNIQEADRLRNAFESSPQFKQFELTRNAYEQQQQQAQQKMLADPRFNQLQNQMQEMQQRFMPYTPPLQIPVPAPRPQVLPLPKPGVNPFQPQQVPVPAQPRPQVLPAQPRPQVLPAQPRPQVLPAQPQPQVLPAKPRPQVLPAQPRPQVLPAQGLTAGIGSLLNKRRM